jgi:hypothetical protein
MFKSVDYSGVENSPDLKAKADYATAILGQLIRTWRDDVEVAWRSTTHDSKSVLELTLSLTLPNASGSASGRISGLAFQPGNEGLLRMDLREVWLDLLDLLIAQMDANLEESFSESVEA